jgi:outer membrane lipoprotein LolB
VGAKPKNSNAWAEHQAALSKINQWQISGKIGVQTAKDAGSANVSWAENGSSYVINLSGALGAGATKVAGNGNNVTLTAPNGQQFKANNAEQLLAEKWGFDLPVNNLRYWIRALPVPGATSQTTFDTQNRLSMLSQSGCTIQYLSYQQVRNVDLPQRLNIACPGLKTKMVIYNWSI